MSRNSLTEFEPPLDAFLPREKQPVAKWVGENIYLDARTSPIPGLYNHDQFPYTRFVFDTFQDPEVEEIDMSWATQTGKTTFLTSVVGWIGDNDPAAAMIGTANEKLAQKNYTRILLPALERVKSLRKRMPGKTRRRWQIVDLGDMWVFYSWPGSTATISDTPIKYLFLNEISLWKTPKGKEGDSVRMVTDRTKAFADAGRKIIIEGKPTVDGECKLTARMETSRLYRLYVPCPRCGEFQRLYKGKSGAPGGVKWVCDYDSPQATQQAIETVHWECEKCEAKHHDDARFAAVQRSVWVPEGQSVEKGGKLVGTPKKGKKRCGFQLSSLYSPLVPMKEFAEEWMTARKDPAELQAVVNGWLAETWKRKSKKTSVDEIKDHAAPYKMGTVPGECLALVMSVDVQEDRFYYVIRAWSWYGSSKLVTRGIAQSWEQVEAARTRTWPGSGGELHKVFLTLIDSADGNRTNEVYEWCAARDACIPIRGEHQYRLLAMVKTGTLTPHDIPIWHIDAGQIRDQFYGVRMAMLKGQPGEWLFPDDVGEDYVRALKSWERREKKVGDKKKMVWVSTSPGYEHFADCEFMQEAFAFVYEMANRQPPTPQPAPPRIDPDQNQRAWIATHRS